jgi:hypothetical protein
MVKLRHAHKLPAFLPRIVGCDRVILPASNNQINFSYSQGQNILRYEIAPTIGMISPFDTPRLKG